VGHQCSAWLVDTVEEAVHSLVKEDIVKGYCEDAKVLMAFGGGNKAGRFLEVAVYIEGGRKGIIWLPKGHNGRSWRFFVGEPRQMLTLHVGKSGSLVSEIPSLAGNLTKVNLRAASGRLFMEVL
jgi:hypothetical protein